MQRRQAVRPPCTAHCVVPASPRRPQVGLHWKWRRRKSGLPRLACTELSPPGVRVSEPEEGAENLSVLLDSLKWDDKGLLAVIVQHVDTGEVLMQAYADRSAVTETLLSGLATFFSRSRGERWCKGETSGNFIRVTGVFPDCDKDCLIYLGEPTGPSCHTDARTCWFTEVRRAHSGAFVELGSSASREHAPLTTLAALEHIIQARRSRSESTPGAKPSWTARLLADPPLLSSKVREEAGELCRAAEEDEGRERVASEAADLLYHCLVLLAAQGVSSEEVFRTLRSRFGTSGVEEKAARKTG